MSTFKLVTLAAASGPGIAAPTMDFYELSRDSLSDADAQAVDNILADCKFFTLKDFRHKFPMADGPHLSQITAQMGDGNTHTVAFTGGAPQELTKIVSYVMENGQLKEY